MIEIKNKYNIELLSPKILKATHYYMNFNLVKNFNGDLTINNFLEVYLLLLTPNNFNKFCSIHTIENKWMWGADLLFGYYKINAGVLHTCVAEHVLPSKANSRDAINLMNDYITKQTPYKTVEEIRLTYVPIIQNITFNHLTFK